MAYKTDWQNAKKIAVTQFNAAMKTWAAEVKKRIDEGDEKLKAKILEESLNTCGLVTGKKTFESYMAFPLGFSTALDKLEAAAKKKGADRKPADIKAARDKVRTILVKYGQEVGHYRSKWKKFMTGGDFCKTLLDALEKTAKTIEKDTADVK